MHRLSHLAILSVPFLFGCPSGTPRPEASAPSVHLRAPSPPGADVTLTSAAFRDPRPEGATERVLGEDKELRELFEEPPLDRRPLERDERIREGRRLYQESCAQCHQEAGTGVEGLFPPLAESDFLVEDKERAIRIVLNGLSGKVLVKGRLYDAFMPSLHQLDDDEIANVLTFALSSWGNDGDTVTADDVAEVRARVRGEWREPPPERAE